VEHALRRQTVPGRQHRNNPTPTEAALWQHLRRRQLDGHCFRRQRPVGPYFADFFCVAAKLASRSMARHTLAANDVIDFATHSFASAASASSE
jgi:hypothetical protein